MLLSPSRPRRRLTALAASISVLAGVGLTAALTTTTSTTATAAAPPTPSGWTSVWVEDFNGPAGSLPDPTKWNIETGGGGWGNAELQNYTNRPSNVSLDGAGNLVITARKEAYGSCWYGPCTHTSARLQTMNKFTQKYGRIEARLKVPGGRGLWPAFWMLGDDIGSVGWPQSGEIDIMEVLGHETNKTYGTLHGPGYSGGASTGASHTLPSGSFADSFHTFRVDWAPDSIKWYVDGVLFSTKTPSDVGSNKWVFDHPHFILLNLAVGGNWPGSPDAATPFPAQYVIDYVATYQADTSLPPAPAGASIAGPGNKCVDVGGDDTAANGGVVQLWDCIAAASDQKWTWNGTSLRTLGRCLDVTSGSVANSAKLQLWDCNGSGAQQWQQMADGSLRNPASGRCVDSPSGSTANGARLQIWDCNGSAAQVFRVGGTPPPTNTLLSQGRPTTSSTNENAGTTANLATDGSTGTRWASAFSDPQWVQVDLGSTRTINRVVLSWEAAYARAFQVQTSNDGVSWTNIYSTTTGTGGTQTLNVSGSGRYVRMTGTQRATPYGYSLWEMQVFGS
ncbi:family 16 glycosylhydrolase [Nocardioides sp.]|uniref:family 16 glycosylhydrolase n=1 Tax=Nocardioides sp. TaxID=35761 RepID=UPI002C856BC3|nr:family 16 glycosylhydrolase [Nocardioides sp.]HXH80799.1 family 16 glycosylhydrolase [Nocardioides sp.]